METSELRGLSFRCREGRACLPTRQGDTPRQEGCGACTFLVARKSGERSADPQFFPFHVYFGRRTEVYLNRSSRGVEPDAAGNLAPAFKDVLGKVTPAQLAVHERRAGKVHADFQRKAQEADVWGDAGLAVHAALAHPWFALPPAPERWAAAVAPFADGHAASRPFYIDAKGRTLVFQREGSRLQVLEVRKDGSRLLEGAEAKLAPGPPPASTVPGLETALRRLARRDVLVGQVYEAVEASRYRLTVEKAGRQRVAQVAADLVVRAQVLEALGVPEELLAGEAQRFYDAEFLEAPTIGGWL